MTLMGINYLNYQENVRSNIARESENSKHNRETETLGRLSFGENVRSNQANEAIKQGSLDENIRSNLANESIKWSTLSETTRSNLANENIKDRQLGETVRSNKAHESISWSQLSEQTRSNQAREAENIRSNLAREVELNRNNVANVKLGEYKTDMAILSDVAPLTSIQHLSTQLNTSDYVSAGVERWGDFGSRILGALGTLSKGGILKQKVG